ncbi:TPA: histidine--tRNA ligase [Candidatus Woesearchaeota archaeon]|nr:histidine--tRNA ligase [Candidatus Woesearchaeota archaeon]HIH31170.1 histidine--tRNA ligase [Candidatus Woesearchaeota archaeon]
MVDMAKGVRDFAPEDKIIRDDMVNKLVSIFQRYGYSPLETPSIERLDTLTAKFAAGSESDAAKEIFKLTDQGQRELGLRFDLTVPFSRFIALNPNLKMPFKRYEIGRVFRDGPIKLGRYREFWQCDVDIAGCSSMKADAEIVLLALDAFKELGLDAFMEINNRKVLYGIMDYCDITPSMRESVIIIVDKIAKQGFDAVRKELQEKSISKKSIDKIEEVFLVRESNEETLQRMRYLITSEIGIEGMNELDELLSYLKFVEAGRIKLNISLARGLAYYTGTVFEGFLKESKVNSSICGGGRYDNMIGMYAENARQYPAVGIAFGLEPITDALKLSGQEEKKTVTQLYIIPIKTFKESLIIATKLREAGLKIDIDLMDKGVSKNLDYANSMKIPYVGFIGETELKEQKIKLKNMHSGKEELMVLDEVFERVNSQ